MTDLAKEKCFVAMQFGKTDEEQKYWADIYEKIIRPAIEAAAPGIEVFRADDDVEPGTISSTYIPHLREDYLCIVDITGRNSNVFYELGLRDSWHNRTILIAQSPNDIPFDKNDDRVLFYDPNGDAGKVRKFDSDIRKSIESIHGEPEKVRNRVQAFLNSSMTGLQQLNLVVDVEEQVQCKGDGAVFRRRVDNLLYMRHFKKTTIETQNSYFECYMGPPNASKTSQSNANLSLLTTALFYQSCPLFLRRITDAIVHWPSIVTDFCRAVEQLNNGMKGLPDNMVFVIAVNAVLPAADQKRESLYKHCAKKLHNIHFLLQVMDDEREPWSVERNV